MYCVYEFLHFYSIMYIKDSFLFSSIIFSFQHNHGGDNLSNHHWDNYRNKSPYVLERGISHPNPAS